MNQLLMRLIALVALTVGALCASSASVGSISSNHYGLSRFRDIPIFGINRPAYCALFSLERRLDRNDGIGGAFQVTPYYTKSTAEDADDRASYFLPNGSNQIVVSEVNSSDYLNFQQDVFAQNFKVATAPTTLAGEPSQTYSALVTFAPRTQVAGIGLSYLQSSRCRQYWFDFTMPVQYCSTQLNIVETSRQAGNDGTLPVTAPANFYPTVTASWMSDDLKYGRFMPPSNPSTTVVNPSGLRVKGSGGSAKLYRWGVGDLEVRGGWELLRRDCVFMAGYIGLALPTARKYNPTYLWDPQLGYAHTAVMWGAQVNVLLKESFCGGTVRAIWNINNRYMFQNRQLRSLDLKGKVWSRYMQVWDNTTPLVTTGANLQPLINYSTLYCKVNPRSALDMNSSFVFERNRFIAELGFNAYARHAEELQLDQSIAPNIGLADFISASALGVGPFTIEQFGIIRGYETPQAAGTYDPISDTNSAGAATFKTISNDDLDLASAAAPGVLAYSVYGALGYQDYGCRFPWFAGLGGLFTFSTDNTVVERWGVFAKFGMSL